MARAAWARDDGAGNVAARLGSAMVGLALALAATAIPIVIHHGSQAAALIVCLVMSLAIANYAPRHVPIIIIVNLLFQNTVVALASNWIDTADEFNAVRGYGFFFTALSWLVIVGHYWLSRMHYPREIRSLMDASTGVMAVLAFYFALGLPGGPSSAAIYLRNIGTPVMMFQIFLITCRRERPDLPFYFLILATVITACGFVELTARETWLAITNGRSYWELSQEPLRAMLYDDKMARQTGLVMTDVMDAFRTTLLNTSLLADLKIELLRVLGPNMHAISFGYALSFFAMESGTRRRVLLPIFILVLLVFVGAKGALITMLFVMTGLVGGLFYRGSLLFWGLSGLLAVYAMLLITTGLRIGDYHVLGLMGGINGFLRAPWGRGLGDGGNLGNVVSALDWTKFQHQGAADVAVESAIGVMLFQIGIGSAAVLGFYFYVAWRAFRVYAQTGEALMGLASFGTLTILVNGLFQEEALFSPLAMGLMLGFAASRLAAARPSESFAPRISPERRDRDVRIAGLPPSFARPPRGFHARHRF